MAALQRMVERIRCAGDFAAVDDRSGLELSLRSYD